MYVPDCVLITSLLSSVRAPFLTVKLWLNLLFLDNYNSGLQPQYSSLRSEDRMKTPM